MKSNITLYADRLINKLKAIPGASAEKGFLAQHINSNNITSYPFFALQPTKETKSNCTSMAAAAEREFYLLVAVEAGPTQDEDLDDALFDMRNALFKGVRLLSLGDNPATGKFTIGEPEFFIPEGYEQTYVAQLTVTITYTDDF